MVVNFAFSRRRLAAVAIDAVIVLGAYYFALGFRFAGVIPEEYQFGNPSFLAFAGLALLLHLGANRVLGVYRIVTRYIGLVQAIRVAYAALCGMALLFVVSAAWPGEEHLLPLSVVAMGGAGAGMGMVGVRFYSRVFQVQSLSNVEPTRRLLIVGAGQAADLVIRDIHQNPRLHTKVVGLVDDDPRLWGMRMHNRPILGAIAEVPEIARERGATEILLAIPSASAEDLARIYDQCRPAGRPIKTLPSLADLIDDSVVFADARELRIEDLLGRPKVETDLAAIGAYLRGKRVLVTGAGGSIGSELCRQVAAFQPASLLLLDRDESALYHLHEELRTRGFAAYQLLPTSILQAGKLEKVFAEARPQVVFHAAAFKHVPLMELHPDEAVLNNVKGTLLVAEAAGRHGVERFVNISTDKAVDPVNVMGATKRVGEQVLRLLSGRYPVTRFCSVRFGNVLGSRGSVIPIFQQQIENGGPVTVTDPEMTRYFMMIEEAVQLVLQAAALTGEIPPAGGGSAGGGPGAPAAGAAPSAAAAGGGYGAFVLEMGKPVRILELARQMIALLARDPLAVEIEYSGLRPGEKLHEDLFCRGEVAAETPHPLVRLACLDGTNGATPNLSDMPGGFEERLGQLIALAERHAGPEEILPALKACVPTYEPFDWSLVGSFPGAEGRA